MVKFVVLIFQKILLLQKISMHQVIKLQVAQFYHNLTKFSYRFQDPYTYTRICGTL